MSIYHVKVLPHKTSHALLTQNQRYENSRAPRKWRLAAEMAAGQRIQVQIADTKEIKSGRLEYLADDQCDEFPYLVDDDGKEWAILPDDLVIIPVEEII